VKNIELEEKEEIRNNEIKEDTYEYKTKTHIKNAY